MTKLAKTILKRAIWLGRGTATVMGLAVLLALTVGLASTALAGTGVGARFDLGKINTVNAMSTLVGSVDGPVLTVENSDEPFIRTFRNVPLSLETRPDAGGHRPPPLQIDSDTLVQQLNADLLDGKSSSQFLPTDGKANDADKLDGKDSTDFVNSTFGTAPNANNLDGKDSTRFFSGKTYEVVDEGWGEGGNKVAIRKPQCDPGDALLTGGFDTWTADEDYVSDNRPDGNGWLVTFRDKGGASFFTGTVRCADFPPLR